MSIAASTIQTNKQNTISKYQNSRFLKENFFGIIRKEKYFLGFLILAFLISFFATPFRGVAMWVGFVFAAYSAVANDSIQTIGTFIASNSNRKWYYLWFFIGGIFVVTTVAGWVINNGDLTYGRLSGVDSSGGLKYPHPESFSFLQVTAPLFLLILTRLKMPVSTTFLLLSCFAVSPGGINDIIIKSVSGYFLAFVLGITVWLLISKFSQRVFKGTAHWGWSAFQWMTSGALWSVWIMQDLANIAVFLPRQVEFSSLISFVLVIFGGLGLLFYLRGDKIQQIVTDKSEITDVRPATIVDLVYAMILVYKLTISTIPMSTTWVFLGLLAGREVAMSIRKTSNRSIRTVGIMIGRDALFAVIGLLVSLLLAIGVNETIRNQFINLLF